MLDGRTRAAGTALLATLLMAGPIRAEVVDAQANGFEVRQSVDIAAPAGKVWDGLGRIGAWWDPVHTFSGDARNMSLDLRVGGCLCEALKDRGGVSHMTVIYVQPTRAARLSGALGPLQSMGLAGHLTWTLAEKNGRTTVTQTYDVGGYARGGADKLAPAVDGVLAQQLARLARYVETGAPN